MANGADSQDDILYRGPYGLVRFARANDGSLMVKAEWDGQSREWRKAFMARFMAITQERNLMLLSPQSFKSVGDGLFEFKHNGQKSRIFTFRDERCWYLVDCFTEKKEDDLPAGVVKRAKERLQEAKSVLARSKKEPGR